MHTVLHLQAEEDANWHRFLSNTLEEKNLTKSKSEILKVKLEWTWPPQAMSQILKKKTDRQLWDDKEQNQAELSNPKMQGNLWPIIPLRAEYTPMEFPTIGNEIRNKIEEVYCES